MKKILITISILSLSLAASTTAKAQEIKAPRLSTGIAIGTTSWGGAAASGEANIEWRAPQSPLAFRIGGMYAQRYYHADKLTIAGADASALYSLAQTRFAPYLIGGLGAYLPPEPRRLMPGVNMGIGLRSTVGNVHPYLEVKMRKWLTSQPVAANKETIGLVFGVNF